MKGKIGKILGAILILACMMYVFISGIVELCNKDKTYTLSIDSATTAISVEHSINGLIPTGTEYYYYGFDSDNEQIYIIKAGKKWLQKNFDDNGLALKQGYKIKAYSKNLDYDISREINTSLSDLEINNINTADYYDSNYKFVAIKKIISFVLILLCVISIFIISKKKNSTEERTSSPVWAILILASGFIGIFLMLSAIQ